MKRKFYKLAAILMVALNVVPVFFTNPVYAITEDEAKTWCSNTAGGTWTNGSCRKVGSGIKQRNCRSKGGTWEMNDGHRNCYWPEFGGTPTTASGGSGSGSGSSGSGSSGSGSGSSGSSSGGSSSGSSGGSSSGGSSGGSAGSSGGPNSCGGVSTAIISCSSSSDSEAIFEILAIALNVATFGVTAAAILGVVITGYQYMTARDNTAQVAKAKNRLLQIVIGLLIWVLFWGVLQFILPGGLFAGA